MSRRTVFTVITPLPPQLSREIVLEELHDHLDMIDLNPLVESRTRLTKPPSRATPEEYTCAWYELVDKIQYLPGGLMSGRVKYYVCFNDLSDGVQTRCYAPLGLTIKDRWSVGGNMPGELRQPTEIGLNMPKDGLWLREDCDMRSNILTTAFVKRNLKNAHKVLVDRLIAKGHVKEREVYNESIMGKSIASSTGSGERSSRLRTWQTEVERTSKLNTPTELPSPPLPSHPPVAELPAELPADENVRATYNGHPHRQSYAAPNYFQSPASHTTKAEPPPRSSYTPGQEDMVLPLRYNQPPPLPEKSPVRDLTGQGKRSTEMTEKKRDYRHGLVYP